MVKNKKATSINLKSPRVLLIFSTIFAVFGLVLTFSTFAAPKKKVNGSVTISAGTVMHGSTTTVAVSPTGTDNHVFIQCYSPDLTGTYVYAAYFPAKTSPVTIGPLTATIWKNSDGACTADLGYFTRDGFGRWVSFAKASFSVKAN